MRLLYFFWNNCKWISSISRYSNVISRSKNTKCSVKILYRECREIAKIYGFGEISSMICLKVISSKEKYWILQNRFQFESFSSFPKAILHDYQRSCKYQYLNSSFVYSMLDDARRIVLYWLCSVFVCGETKIFRFFCQQRIK